jgi:sterol-4alpha-carboxylate 3-dehydrogenase (decarboxylating)
MVGGPARYAKRDLGAVMKINVEGTKNVVEAAKRAGVRIFVYTSSCMLIFLPVGANTRLIVHVEGCAITDDMYHEYPNMDESLPLGHASLIYGYSKVCI